MKLGNIYSEILEGEEKDQKKVRVLQLMHNPCINPMYTIIVPNNTYTYI